MPTGSPRGLATQTNGQVYSADAASASGDAESSVAQTAARETAMADGCSTAPGAPTTALPMLVALIALSLMRRREE